MVSGFRKNLTLSRANQLSLFGNLVLAISLYFVVSRLIEVSYTTDTVVGTYMGVLRTLQLQSPYGFSIKPLLDKFGFSPSRRSGGDPRLVVEKGGVSFHHIADLCEPFQVLRVLRQNVVVSCMNYEAVSSNERFSLQDRIPEPPRFRLIYPYKSGFFDHFIKGLQVFRGPVLIVLP